MFKIIGFFSKLGFSSCRFRFRTHGEHAAPMQDPNPAVLLLYYRYMFRNVFFRSLCIEVAFGRVAGMVRRAPERAVGWEAPLAVDATTFGVSVSLISHGALCNFWVAVVILPSGTSFSKSSPTVPLPTPINSEIRGLCNVMNRSPLHGIVTS